MRYLLDTNALITLLNHPRSMLARRARREAPENVGTSAIVFHELFYGAFKGRHTAENLARLDTIQIETLEFDNQDSRQAAILFTLIN